MLHKVIMALFATILFGALWPSVASARGGFGTGGIHSGGSPHGGFGPRVVQVGSFPTRSASHRSVGWFGGQGRRGAQSRIAAGGLVLVEADYGRTYGYGDDYPYGYGEYAEYGPWARDRGCYLARQNVLTPYGRRRLPIRICD
jgi:hypothetical protein